MRQDAAVTPQGSPALLSELPEYPAHGVARAYLLERRAGQHRRESDLLGDTCAMD